MTKLFILEEHSQFGQKKTVILAALMHCNHRSDCCNKPVAKNVLSALSKSCQMDQ